MTLSQLLCDLPIRSVHGSLERSVGQVSDRDTDIATDDVFVAIKGAHVDGHDRVKKLSQASAVVIEHPCEVPPGPTVIEVAATRRVLGPLCATRLGQPGAAMSVVGFTGTNGKTTSTFLLAAMGKAAGLKVGVIGTTGHSIDGRPIPTQHTTPDAPVLQKLLAQMRAAGVQLVAMEVSSIGLDTFRVDGTPFAAATFTNLSRDHLDHHGSMTAYGAAKARLFHELLTGTAILNRQDPAAMQMCPTHRPVWWYGTPDADLRLEAAQLGPMGSRGCFVTPKGNFDGDLRLVGYHNVENALGALGAGLAVGLPLEACQAGLANLAAVPGRLEPVPNQRGINVLVDYAHTDDALKRVLFELRRLKPARILTVFGCGGDRDPGKRPLMGQAAAEGSDQVFVTSDNPRSEDPMVIIQQILPGIGTTPCCVEPDRAEAIRRAIGAAQAGDIVLIAGKGHEDYQQIGSVKLPFDDRKVAAEVLA